MGIGVVPLNDAYTQREIEFYVQDAKVLFLISEAQHDGILCVLVDEILTYINKQVFDFKQKKQCF